MISASEIIEKFVQIPDYSGKFTGLISQQVSIKPFWIVLVISLLIAYFIKRKMEGGFIWWIIMSIVFYTVLTTWGL